VCSDYEITSLRNVISEFVDGAISDAVPLIKKHVIKLRYYY